jgi:undecaprenyl-diphosphatase
MLVVAVVLGIVEGITEFLPISSTGHLILVGALLKFEGRRAETFEVFIQLGAILAVVWEFRSRLGRMAKGIIRGEASRAFGAKIAMAFVPVAVVGLLAHDVISRVFFRPVSVALALIVGGVLILVVEKFHPEARTHDAERVSWGQALAIGVAQCLSLWSGFSRSAATILGGLSVGLDRRAAVEFSFFLALPTMFVATFYDLVKYRAFLERGDALWLSISFAVSFVVAWGSIRWLLRYVSSHSFRIFAWYRLILGAAVLLLAR